MTWEVLNHDCLTDAPGLAGVSVGSVWRCDCGRRWECTQRDTFANGAPVQLKFKLLTPAVRP